MWSPEAPSHSVLHYSSDCLGHRRRQVVDTLQEHVLIDEVRCVGVVDTYKYPPDKAEVVNRRIGAETPKTSVGTDELRGAEVRAALVVQDAHAPDVGSAHAAGDDAIAIRQIVHAIGENATGVLLRRHDAFAHIAIVARFRLSGRRRLAPIAGKGSPCCSVRVSQLWRT